jgi:hypothetical protein
VQGLVSAQASQPKPEHLPEVATEWLPERRNVFSPNSITRAAQLKEDRQQPSMRHEAV